VCLELDHRVFCKAGLIGLFRVPLGLSKCRVSKDRHDHLCCCTRCGEQASGGFMWAMRLQSSGKPASEIASRTEMREDSDGILRSCQGGSGRAIERTAPLPFYGLVTGGCRCLNRSRRLTHLVVQ
jgi:hypothetical protein